MRHVRPIPFAFAIACAAGSVSGPARADRTILVGGSVLEGKATRKGGKVVVEMESGEVTLPADAVARIEKSESTVGEYEARYAALPAGDVAARLALADYCRDHGMRARERALLMEVIDIDPNNGTARARLGYVRTETGWITFADSMRAKGMVEHEGRWVTPAEAARLQHEQSEADSARRRNEAEAELEQQRLQAARQQNELAERQAELDAERARFQQSSIVFPPIYGYGSYGYGSYGYGPYVARPASFGFRNAAGFCGPGRVCGALPGGHPVRAPTPVTGPSDTSMSVVKVPYSHGRH